MPRSCKLDAHRLDEAQAAGAVAHRRRDAPRDVQPIGGEIDVVGDERHAGADDRGAGRGMRRRRPEIGAPIGLLQLGRQTFELAAADVLEIAARRATPRLLRTGRPAGCGGRDLLRHRLASATQSAIVAPSIGTKGTTSTAPRRGCSPECCRRSIARQRRVEQREDTAARTDAGAPANVNTVRLCAASGLTSSRRAPVDRMAAAQASSTSLRRPSLMFGMHSMSAMGRVLPHRLPEIPLVLVRVGRYNPRDLLMADPRRLEPVPHAERRRPISTHRSKRSWSTASTSTSTAGTKKPSISGRASSSSIDRTRAPAPISIARARR